MPLRLPLARVRVHRGATAIVVLSLLTLFSWSLSSPAGSGPDENFHATSIWCGWGSNDDLCRDDGVKDVRSVPFNPTNASCFAGSPGQSAECQNEFPDRDRRTDVTWGNFVGLYPPVYYAVMRVFVGMDYDNSVLTMRLVNSLIFVAVVGLLALLIPVPLRRTMLWSLLISVVPLGLFVLASINPSGWSVLSAATLWVALYAQFDATGRRRIALGAFALVVALMGSGARGDSCLYSSLAVVVVFVLRWGRLRSNRGPVALGLAVVAMSAVLFLSSGQSNVASNGLFVPPEMLSSASKLEITVHNLQSVPYLLTGMFGSWPLGWFDTEMPPVVFQSALLVFACVTFTGLSRLTTRKAIAVGGVAISFVAFPLVVLAQGHQFVGLSVQPRYLLPLLVMLAGLCLHLAGPNQTFQLNRMQLGLVGSGLSSANALALHANIRRYVTGIDVNGINLDSGREWWWGVPVDPMTVWIVGSMAFAGACFLILTMRTDPVDQPTPPSSHRQASVSGRSGGGAWDNAISRARRVKSRS